MTSASGYIRTALWQRKRPLAVAGVSLLLVSALVVPAPLITGRIIDKALPAGDHLLLVQLLALAFGLMLIQKLGGFFLRLFFQRLNEVLILELKETLLARVHQAPLSVSNHWGRGYLISRIEEDANQVRVFLADTFFHAFRDVLVFLFGMIALLLIHWKLALSAMVLLPVFVLISRHYGVTTRRMNDVYLEDRSRQLESLSEALEELEAVKSEAASKFTRLRFRRAGDQALGRFLQLFREQECGGTLLGFVAGLAPFVVIGYGAFEIMASRLTLGELIAFNQFVGYLFGPTQRLTQLHISINRARAALDRLNGLFQMEKEDITDVRQKISSLEVIDLCFAREGRPILSGLSFRLEKGSMLGVFGASGSGKSTLARILCGLIPADSGVVKINGERLQDVSELMKWRGAFFFVGQEPSLYHATIKENVCLKEELDDHAGILQCLEWAGAAGFVEERPHGIETNVGVRGSQFSVGQKQRLVLARALYSGADVLVFDEVTANLDPVTTQNVLDALTDVLHNHIIVVISHQEEVIARCTTVLEIGDIPLVGA